MALATQHVNREVGRVTRVSSAWLHRAVIVLICVSLVSSAEVWRKDLGDSPFLIIKTFSSESEWVNETRRLLKVASQVLV